MGEARLPLRGVLLAELSEHRWAFVADDEPRKPIGLFSNRGQVEGTWQTRGAAVEAADRIDIAVDEDGSVWDEFIVRRDRRRASEKR